MTLQSFAFFGFWTMDWWVYVLLLLVVGALVGLLIFLRKQNEDD